MINEIKLSREEFTALVDECVRNVLSEMDGKTLSRIHNATGKAQKRIADTNDTSPMNYSIIDRGVDLDIRATEHFMQPYKGKYLFHCMNLRGVASFLVFDLTSLKKLSWEKTILTGTATFNGKQLRGRNLTINLVTNEVYYTYDRYRYKQTIDPHNKEKWNSLLEQLKLCLENWDSDDK